MKVILHDLGMVEVVTAIAVGVVIAIVFAVEEFGEKVARSWIDSSQNRI